MISGFDLTVYLNLTVSRMRKNEGQIDWIVRIWNPDIQLSLVPPSARDIQYVMQRKYVAWGM